MQNELKTLSRIIDNQSKSATQTFYKHCKKLSCPLLYEKLEQNIKKKIMKIENGFSKIIKITSHGTRVG